MTNTPIEKALEEKLQEIIEKDGLPWYMQPLSFDEIVDFLQTIPRQREWYREHQDILREEMKGLADDLAHPE